MSASSSARHRTVLVVGAFPFPLPRGSQVYARGMAEALVRRGHRVWMATYGWGEGPWPTGVLRVPGPRVRRRFTGSGPQRAKPWLDLRLAAAVADLLRREPVDVVHAHNVEGPFVAWAARARAGVAVPVVYDVHTALAEELPTYLGPRWATAAGWAGGAVDRMLARRCDAAVALSARAAEALRHAGARQVAHLPPGVDPDEVAGGDAARARASWGLDARPWVLYAGNVDAYQDLDVLVAAMAGAGEAGLLLVTGDAARARAVTASLPPDRVRVVADPGLPALRDALAVATVASVPRAVCAGFPVKLLNFAAAGVPTVAARGSARDVGGVVPVANRDPGALRTAILRVIDDPALRARLAVEARHDVAARWHWDARAAALDAWHDTWLVGSARDAPRSAR